MAEEKVRYAFHDVDADTFPFKVETHDEATGELLWEQTVHGPGAIKVPGFHPRKVQCTVIYLRSGMKVVTNSQGIVLEP